MSARRLCSATIVLALVAALAPAIVPSGAYALPNPVATDEPTYQAFGRVFPDPHGCLAHNVPDANEDGIKDTPKGVSPWAKGRVCADQFLSYEEVIEGAKFMSRRFPEFVEVIRLDQAYDNPNYRSAGIPRTIAMEDGTANVLDRDRRPLYMFRVTDRTSSIPQRDREHFAFSLSIHGPERAGLEGGVRAMEDLVTWAACERPEYQANTPACEVEGPFPKKIVESATDKPVPTAGEALKSSVLYFTLPNPDGWGRGQTAPVEVEDGGPNTSYLPGMAFQRFNGNGVDLNRDWPTIGYTLKSYSPGSEPETKAFADVLSGIKARTTEGRFAGGLDLHGMLTAKAFSYTLIGAGQRDYGKNAVTVETSLRTWEDQTKRLQWSPYISDHNANGQQDSGTTPPEICRNTNGTDATPCVADRWGTVIDTIGYQVTGGFGDWFDSPLGLDAVGVDNEMFVSHVAPNSVFEPALEQTHIDGNKGLIFSQIAALLTRRDETFRPGGVTGYVFDPNRLQIPAQPRVPNPGLPAQNDVDVVLPCQDQVAQNADGFCGEGDYVVSGTGASYEFTVEGPDQEVWNGGVTATTTHANVNGISPGALPVIHLDYFDEGQWQPAGRSVVSEGTFYHQAGRIVTVNDPEPGRWRVRFGNVLDSATRLRLDFHPHTAESSPGQAAIDASSMDFFSELNEYVPDGEKLAPIGADVVARSVLALRQFDSLVLVNQLGSRSYLVDELGLSEDQAARFFDNLEAYVRSGGNLILTDKALGALPEMGLLPPEAVSHGTFAPAPSFNFNVPDNGLTYQQPAEFPLAAGLDLPGAAERTTGQRQGVEPTPLGYTPDSDDDATPAMPISVVNRAAWQTACGKAAPGRCTTALGTARTRVGSQNQTVTGVSLGELDLGDGRIRIAGNLFPNPAYEPDATNDHRFGLASYALTYTGYIVFENLLEWSNPARIDPSKLQATTLAFTPVTAPSGYHSDKAPVELSLTTQDGTPVADAPLRVELTTAGEVLESYSLTTNEEGLARVMFELDEAPGEYGLVATFDESEPFLASLATASFLVRRELTRMVVGVSGSGDGRTVTARLTDDDGVPLAGRTVSFWVDGNAVQEQVETNDDGVAKIQAPPGYRDGVHTYTVVFDGDATHDTSSGSATSRS
ncbi:MAG TPA: M14 family zinc carboxypeptidase [Actinomycetota bacterium]|nr:M14 family zinc carboxypeptidase [Actinomycetota bacterium]